MDESGRKKGSEAPYRAVRSLRRGLMIIENLARHGWMRPAELSKATGIDRSSVYRLLQTLAELDYIDRREEDGAASLTSRIRELADGVRRDEVILDLARLHMASLTNAIQWPSDLALLNGGLVTIQESTHGLSPITFHRATIRQERSLFESALGRAIMTVLTPEELDMLMDIIAARGDFVPAREAVHDLLREYRKLGYAWAAGAYDQNVSAIALGFRGPNQVIGSLNIVFFRRVLSPAAAAERYLEPLRRCVSAIEAVISGK